MNDYKVDIIIAIGAAVIAVLLVMTFFVDGGYL